MTANINAVRAARDHCLALQRGHALIYDGRYRHLFEPLTPLKVTREQLYAPGRPGEPCNVGVEFTDEPGSDATLPAVWPFFGQFIAHDITVDRSPLGHHPAPGEIRNFRTPRANLEGIYGASPVGSPYLYDTANPAKLLIGSGGHDLPRNQQGTALIGDPRNDVHLFMNADEDRLGCYEDQVAFRLAED